jgi:hypothetical protein
MTVGPPSCRRDIAITLIDRVMGVIASLQELPMTHARSTLFSSVRIASERGMQDLVSVERDSKEIPLDSHPGISIDCGIRSWGEERFPGHVNDPDDVQAF